MTYCQTQQDSIRDVNGIAEGELMSPSAYYSMLFNVKVNAGTYKKQAVNCFCGSNNYIQITTKDRYGIDYSLCLCKDCGILYSNPRMTEESFKLFYENDYRNIYSDRVEIGEVNTRVKDLVYDTLKDYELPLPKIVFEIGCGTGSNLIAYKDCECIGIDYDNNVVEKGKASGLNLYAGGIEILEGLGKKADLIIMNHVLEHFTDIEMGLKRVRNLLSDNGSLYIGVPGLYKWDRNSLFQNAHNYQFCGNTLCYVMYCCGFEEYYLDETIESLWYKAGYLDKKKKNAEEHRSIGSYLTGKKFLMPQIRLNCKFTLAERRRNIKYAVNSGMPEINKLINIHPDSEGIIICGGPTIEDYPERIKELQTKGVKVYSIERMYQWCLKHNIIPDYIVVLDASDDVVESFTNIHPDTIHIVVAHVKSEIVDKLKGFKTYYYHLMQKGVDYSKLYDDTNQKITFINSGGSVSLCSMAIAMTLGAKKLHIFGFDCHVNGTNYAKGITGVGCINETMNLEIDGRKFKTTSAYYAFMQQFFNLYQTGVAVGLLNDVKIYGDSMVTHACKKDIRGI